MISEKNNLYIDFDACIFIIGCWVETDIQKVQFIECIKKVREIGKVDILVVSHIPISSDLIKLTDYFIYDKKNLLITSDTGTKTYLWFNNYLMRVEKDLPSRNDYAIFSSMKNGFNFSKFLGKKYIFYMEYDNIIDPEEFKMEFIQPLIFNDICAMKGIIENKYEMSLLNIFSLRIDLGMSFVDMYSNLDEYMNKLNSIDSPICMEHIFDRFVNENSKKTHISTIKSSVINKFVSPDLYFIDNDVFLGYILSCLDKDNVLYIFIVNYSSKNIYQKISVKFMNKIIDYHIMNYMNMDVIKVGEINDLVKNGNEYICIDDSFSGFEIYKKTIYKVVEESKNCKIEFYDEDQKKNVKSF